MTLQEYLANPTEGLVGPSISIYKYTDQIYKIVRFKSPRGFLVSQAQSDRSRKDNEAKLASSVSRARRVIMELALCNKWDWFCTFTLDKEKYDRTDLPKFYKDFTQWIRDQRKATGHQIKYLLIPELHDDDQSWHMHGLFFDVPPLKSFAELRYVHGWKVPNRLVSGCFHCWVEYHNKFGFCSFGRLRRPVAAGLYVTKYITKSLADSNFAVGSHLYYASQGLLRPVKQVDVYHDTHAFDRWLVNDYEYVQTGMTWCRDHLDWSFAMEYDQFPDLIPLDQAYFGEEGCIEDEIDNMYTGVQTMLSGFGKENEWQEEYAACSSSCS